MLGDANETDTENGVTSNETTPVRRTYAGILDVPGELRKFTREQKNEEKIEVSEMEKRANNIIIHGAEEFGENNEEIKEKDNEYAKEILKLLGVVNNPKSVSRLGQPNDNKRRPLKLVMKTKEDKEKAMGNLRRLKGTQDDFGKISVTDDYTTSEREEIKSWVEKAKEKTSQDPDKVYKVRGDPKNGLRLVWFNKD